jgi:hypothetical protein
MKTMNRCLGSRAFAALAAVLAGLLLTLSVTTTAALAQGFTREAPKDVVLGRMVITAPPEITLNGKADRLSPGSRIRDLNNMLVLSASAVGREMPVVYRRDAAGLVHEAWILTEDEYRRLGGVPAGSEGVRLFNELLLLIFGARR